AWMSRVFVFLFFFQAEDGIRDRNVTGVQTCALPIYVEPACHRLIGFAEADLLVTRGLDIKFTHDWTDPDTRVSTDSRVRDSLGEIGRASCRERVEVSVGGGGVSRKAGGRSRRRLVHG